MIQKPQYFDLEEIVCPHVYYKYGEMAWQFFDPRQLALLDWTRIKIGPMYANNWMHKYENSDYIRYIRETIQKNGPIIQSEIPVAPGDLFDERGIRCNLCSTVLAKTKAGVIYLSGHILGKATDYNVQGKLAEEVRQWFIKNKGIIPYPIRLEKGVSWVHQDCEDNLTGEKVTLVNP
jgi:hypothetical protein